MKHYLPLLFLTLLLSSAAMAAGPDGIAAIVGSEPISNYDVDARIQFIMATTKLSHTPDVIERIRPQVLRSLIDEKLELQAAKKLELEEAQEAKKPESEASKKASMKITQADIDQAIATIESERGMEKGAILRQLEAAHVPKQTFIDQIHAQLALSKLVAKEVRPNVHISDGEIEMARHREMLQPPKQEMEIAAMALPIDKPEHEAEVKKLADKLVKEMRDGANFEEVSRQFAGGARPGGKVETFWVRPDQLDPELVRSLGGAKAGSISDPVRTQDGFRIVKVYATRSIADTTPQDAEVQVKEILLKLKPTAQQKEADVLLGIGEQVAKNPGACQDKSVAGIDQLKDVDITVDVERSNLSELPQGVRTIVDGLKPGEISTPFASDAGIRLYMLCERKEGGDDRARIANLIFAEKMELAVQKYMRDLRRGTFIEIR